MFQLELPRLSITALTLALTALLSPVQAHELRFLKDNYLIQVGGDVEPPYTGVKNGIDVYVFHDDHPEMPDFGGVVGLDKNNGDKVKLEAISFITETADFNSPITSIIPLNKSWKVMPSDGFFLYYQANAFNIKKPTSYGFFVQGTIQRAGFKAVHFAEKFVCETGSQDSTYGTAFECITDAPPTPTPLQNPNNNKMLLGNFAK